jgi:hypothetical protein
MENEDGVSCFVVCINDTCLLHRVHHCPNIITLGFFNARERRDKKGGKGIERRDGLGGETQTASSH